MSDADVYEMLWDCKYCGAKKLLGQTHRHCPSCGAPQDVYSRYFPADQDKVAVRDHVYVGADLRCGSCGEASSAAAKHCGNCGSPLTGAAAVATQADQVNPERAQPRQGSPIAPQAGPSLGNAAVEPTGRGCRIFALLAGAFVLVVIVSLGVFFSWTRDANVEVIGHHWERSIEIERYQKVDEGNWCDGLPKGAEVFGRERRERSTKKVPDGEECSVRKQDRGDGTFQESRECKPKYRDEPVYDQYCRYRIERWKAIRTAKSSGQSLTPAPEWPSAELTRTGQCLGCEREAKRRAKYTVLLREGKSVEIFECDLGEVSWHTFAVGRTLRAAVRQLGGGVDCSSLADKK